MKKILKISSLAFLLISGIACENDDQKIVAAKGDPELITPADGASYALNPSNASSEATTLVWNHADYSQQTEVNYDVEVAVAGTNFETIIPGGAQTNNRFYVWTVGELLSIASEIGLSLEGQTTGTIDVRIKASLGANNEVVSYSNVIKLTLTLVDPGAPVVVELPQLAVPGNHQGWNPGSAPRIAASAPGQTDYEGYVWLDGEFKFVGPDSGGVYDWNAGPDYGDNGDFSGILVETGESNCTAPAGYYRVQANTTALTYNTTAVSWGIIGAATPTGWDSDTDFVYNSTTKKLEIANISLVPGAFKFRGNNAWSNGFDLGTVDADGYLQSGGDLTFDGPAGNYKVILDLSNPRRYTYELIAL